MIEFFQWFNPNKMIKLIKHLYFNHFIINIFISRFRIITKFMYIIPQYLTYYPINLTKNIFIY